MKLKLIFLMLLISLKVFSQDYIFGKISDEGKTPISSAEIINMRTDQVVFSDSNGNFMIAAIENDELRVVKNKYDRVQFRLKSDDFKSQLKVTIFASPELIQEVSLAFKPTGNLKKDLDKLPKYKKTRRLQDEITQSLIYKPTEVMPRLSTPSAFAPPNYSAGQVDVKKLAEGVAGLIGKWTKPKITEPDYNETQDFLKKLKESINKNYYYKYGLSEEQLENFLVEANQQLKLARLYRKDFDIAEIEFLLHKKFKTYTPKK